MKKKRQIKVPVPQTGFKLMTPTGLKLNALQHPTATTFVRMSIITNLKIVHHSLTTPCYQNINKAFLSKGCMEQAAR